MADKLFYLVMFSRLRPCAVRSRCLAENTSRSLDLENEYGGLHLEARNSQGHLRQEQRDGNDTDLRNPLIPEDKPNKLNSWFVVANGACPDRKSSRRGTGRGLPLN